MVRKLKQALFVFGLLITTSVLFAGSVGADNGLANQMDGEGTEEDPYIVTDVEELQAVNDDLDAYYVLGNDIDASETASWDAGAGFKPIGDRDSGDRSQGPFTGVFDGDGHEIIGLTIDRPGENNVGLFGSSDGEITHTNIEDANIEGSSSVGALIGNNDGNIHRSYASGEVVADGDAGGLVGYVGADSTNGEIKKTGSDVAVNGATAGGLIGWLSEEFQVTESYAHGEVEAIGGRAGGLIGYVTDNSAVQLSYSTGSVIDSTDNGIMAGGTVGHNEATINGVFTTGDVAAEGNSVSGLVGNEDGDLSDGHWNSEVSRQSETDADTGTALRVDEMTGADASTNMASLDFDNFWTLTDEYPVLEWQVEDVSISLDESTVGAGETTSATVTLTLDDGSTVTASEVADYDVGGIADVDAGTVNAEQQGTAEITATVAGESDSVELEITEPPQIELEGTELDADAVVEGSSLTATATYENDGGPGSHTAELIADGDVVDSQTVTLDADDETTIDFAWTPDGTVGSEYDLAIDDTDLGSIEIVEPGTITLDEATFPDRVGSGAPYEFTVDLDNVAEETVIDTVAYERDDESVVTEPVAVDPDGTTEILSDQTDADVGLTIAHEVTVHDETLTGTSDVTDPPEFEIDAVDAPDEVEPNEEFELTATIENTGGVEGTQTVSVSDDESAIESEELTIESGASEEVSIAVTETETGDYEYTVETDDEETTASVTVAETESDDDADDSDGLPGFGVAAAIVALSIALVARRQR